MTDQPKPASAPHEERRQRLRERLRAEIHRRGEEDGRRPLGRGLTAEELEHAISVSSPGVRR